MTAHDPRLEKLDTAARAEAVAARAEEERQERRAAALILGASAVGVGLWAGAIAAFGLAGLILPAVALTPVVVLGLVTLTRG